MPKRDPERRRAAQKLQAQLAQENVLTAAQARTFARGLQYSWNELGNPSSPEEVQVQLNDARRLLQAARILRSIDGAQSTQAQLCYRRAGELFEWLVRAKHVLNSAVPAELLAGGAYQLGGLPAMSAAIIDQADLKEPGLLLFAAFLRADFDGVLKQASFFWRRHPALTTRAGSIPTLAEGGEGGGPTWYFTVELVRGLALVAHSLRVGQPERLSDGMRKLVSLDEFATRAMPESISILMMLISQSAEAFAAANVYKALNPLIESNPASAAKFARFAREQFRMKRGILWASQLEGVRRLATQSSFALCTPTGSGKTLVANLALLKELLNRSDDSLSPLALYLVPSRALASEVESKLSRELGRGFIVTGLYGGADWGVTDFWITADQPTVLIATVEKAEALMRYLGAMLRARLKLLIIDEAHQIVAEDDARTEETFSEHRNRPLRLEGLVSRILALIPHVVRIALTAVAGGAAPHVARWIEGREDAEAVGMGYRSTRQLIGTLETSPGRPGRISLEMMNGRLLFVRGREEPPYISLKSAPMPAMLAEVRGSLYRFNQLDILWTALHLRDERRRVLISLAQNPEQTMGWYVEALRLDDWQEAAEFRVPRSGRLQELIQRTEDACVDYCGEDSFELALLKRGIATSHGQMPQRLRRLMTEVIEKGACPITVATATLTEGVNLPFDIIFLPSVRRTTFNKRRQRTEETPLSAAEFRNLSGRAGRPGTTRGMEGLTLVALPQRPSTTAPKQIRTQRRQQRSLARDYQRLRTNLLKEESGDSSVNGPLSSLMNALARQSKDHLGLTGTAFLQWLDHTSPADVSAEAGFAIDEDAPKLADTLDELDAFLLTALQEVETISVDGGDSADAELRLKAIWRKTFTAFTAANELFLERAFIRRGQAVVEAIYPDENERKKLYLYGMTPHIGRRFDGIVEPFKTILANADSYGSASTRERLRIFFALGSLLASDRGFGFRVRSTQRDTALLNGWRTVLSWWMQAGDTEPEPKELRGWLRFASDNLEFRLGVAVGAVVARLWSEGADDPSATPSLESWRETTGLPWFGFWARELLRWGTLDPFVAFALAQGLVGTRDEGTRLRLHFDNWLRQERPEASAEDLIDPQLFIRWQASRATATLAKETPELKVRLADDVGKKQRYHVVPAVDRRRGRTYWLDPAGYRLAESGHDPDQVLRVRDDYELTISERGAFVRRVS